MDGCSILFKMNKMKSKLYFLFVVVVLSMTTSAQSTHADSMKIITTALRKQNMITSEYIGFAATPSAGWVSGAWMATIASEKELTTLIKDRNPVVRIWAYRALLVRNGAVSKKLARRLLRDKKVISVMVGCVVREHPVRELVRETTVVFVREDLAAFDEMMANSLYQRAAFEALKAGKSIPQEAFTQPEL